MRPWEYSAFAVTVADARDIAPGWRRLTLAAPELRDFAPWGLDQRIKLVLPLPDGGLADFGLMTDPTPHPSDWYARWKALPETERNVLRTYTPSAIRPEQGEIDVDVLLHEPPGPASAWAAQATPGERLWITGPDRRNGWTGYGLHWQPVAGATRWLLVGDETAFPAIANILRTLPEGGRADVLLEAADVRDDIDAGRLVRVLEDWTPVLAPLSLYYPSRRNPTAAFKAFVDFARRRSHLTTQPGRGLPGSAQGGNTLG